MNNPGIGGIKSWEREKGGDKMSHGKLLGNDEFEKRNLQVAYGRLLKMSDEATAAILENPLPALEGALNVATQAMQALDDVADALSPPPKCGGEHDTPSPVLDVGAEMLGRVDKAIEVICRYKLGAFAPIESED